MSIGNDSFFYGGFDESRSFDIVYGDVMLLEGR